MKKILNIINIVLSCLVLFSNALIAQTPSGSSPNNFYWQQHVDYKMEIDMDVKSYQYKGKQTLVYTNNSPDVLDRVFYHLYFNAFQPGSEMDVHSQTISDPDSRILDRINFLKPSEIGYIHVSTLLQNNTPLKFKTVGTILEVDLNKPIQPGEKVTFEMDFNAQVPVQIRRSGRNNKESVALSMSQWYPKMAEYDFEGWHADPYIGREFYGVWGDFDVKLTIDKNYVVGGSGYLQNPNEIGHGYETGKINRPDGDKLTWHFNAPFVHDFTWAADPEFEHDIKKVRHGPIMHFFYKKTMDPEFIANWKRVQKSAVDIMTYYSENIGQYPYDQYSIIQGGDSGMEYAMCTLITGERDLESLKGVIFHELAHTWFQFLLATNEGRHEWMDEGFSTYIGSLAKNDLLKKGFANPVSGSYKNYYELVYSGKEQPATIYDDRYIYNRTHTLVAYSKGAVFLAQLGYIIGEDNLKNTLKNYFIDWAFKHPTPNDFIRVAEKTSGIELDWYLIDFMQTTNTIDYAVSFIEGNANKTTIQLQRNGPIAMPIDLEVEYENGSKEMYYIPLRIMRGEKPTEDSVIVLEDWAWAYPTYSFTINTARHKIKSVTIDPKNLMADVFKLNNKM